MVIPARNEGARIAAAIGSARDGATPPASRDGDTPPSRRDNTPPEIAVVDGGSEDDTAARARTCGARVLRALPGRARQLEVGWRATSAPAILFLHADTTLPQGYAAAVRRTLADPANVGGAFRLRFDDRTWAMRCIEWGARLRAALFGLPYGDQALFVRRDALERMGGIAPVPIMEDLDLVREMKRRGRLVLLPLPVTTAARRYRQGGTWRVCWRNALALAAWRWGVDRARLAAWYRS